MGPFFLLLKGEGFPAQQFERIRVYWIIGIIINLNQQAAVPLYFLTKVNGAPVDLPAIGIKYINREN